MTRSRMIVLAFIGTLASMQASAQSTDAATAPKSRAEVKAETGAAISKGQGATAEQNFKAGEAAPVHKKKSSKKAKGSAMKASG